MMTGPAVSELYPVSRRGWKQGSEDFPNTNAGRRPHNNPQNCSYEHGDVLWPIQPLALTKEPLDTEHPVDLGRITEDAQPKDSEERSRAE